MSESRYNEVLKEAVAEAEKTMRCNCDLDNWEPEIDTGHSFVCRIHRAAKKKADHWYLYSR